MPAITFATMAEVPEGLKEFATEADGKVTVKVVPEAKLDEFRTKNISLAQQVESLGPIVARVKTLAGDDLDKFETDLTGLRDIAKRVQDGELKTNDQIEAAVAERVKAVRDGYDDNSRRLSSELTAEKDKVLTLTQRLDQNIINGAVTNAVIHPESGVRPEALTDIMNRAYAVFKVEGGKLVAKNGDATIYGANGADPMTPTEWLAKLKDDAPYFFKGNGGGGAGGNGKDGGTGGLTAAQIAALSPEQKIALANKLGSGKR